MTRRLAGLLALAATLFVALVLLQERDGERVVSGFVEADEVRVGSRVGGRVAAVLVEEGDRVEEGEVLVELEPHALRERLARAEAELAARRAELARFEAGSRPEEIAQREARRDRLAAELERAERGPRSQEIATARARLELAEAELGLAEQELARVRALVESDVASAEQLDRATTEREVALSSVEVRREELALLEEGEREEVIAAARASLREAEAALALARAGFREEEIAEARAAVAAAAAEVGAVGRDLAELAVRSPVEGRVEALRLRPGDLVAPDAPVLSLLDPARLWVRTYVPQTHLWIELGDELPVTVDALPGERFTGRVVFVARRGEFTPGNVQAPEERGEQVFRVKLDLDPVEHLRPGMTASVHLERDE